MKQYQHIGSEEVSKVFYLPEHTEQSFEKAEQASKNGIFVGHSLNYSIPFFINFDLLINPHIFILGMSGAGKTFLMRSLLFKIYSTLGSSLVVIDFTGEYRESSIFSYFKESNIEDLYKSTNSNDYSIFYFGYKDQKESKKVSSASEILGKIIEIMRGRPLDSKKRIFIVLDEAWKVLKENRNLEILIREGRKYNVGLILASQLIEDIETPILANTATFFAFRTQNKKSLEKLSRNYNLSERLLLKIQNLDVGSCLVIQIYKSGLREAFLVKRVLGVRVEKYVNILIGDLTIDVNENELFAIIRRLSEKDPSGLISEVSEQKNVELHFLIKKLILLGANRRRILESMRGLGIEDYEISDAFALAVEEIGEMDGKPVSD